MMSRCAVRSGFRDVTLRSGTCAVQPIIAAAPDAGMTL